MIESKWLIKLKLSGRYIVDAPPTGFKSTFSLNKATRFDTQDDAIKFINERGIFPCQIILNHFDV